MSLTMKKEKLERLKKLRNQFKNQRFMKRCIILMFSTVIIFTLAVFVVFCVTGDEPTTLVENFFGFFGIEGGVMAIIKSSESISKAISSNATTSNKSKKTSKTKKIMEVFEDGDVEEEIVLNEESEDDSYE